MKTMATRLLQPPKGTFFLLGPRGVGKTTWLKATFPTALRFDLLHSETFLSLSRNPSLLEARIGKQPPGTTVIIDEIQKLPALLDEVHRLIEEKRLRFVLTGSSARKLKRSGANLLAGRAVTREMSPFASAEWPVSPFNLTRALEWGGLPLSVLSDDPADFLQSYFYTYLKEEIQEEGLIRQIEPFIRFLEVAGLANGEVLNIEALSRDCGSKRVTLDKWFLILEDTLVGFRLPAWRPRIKARESAHPKFYWFDPGVARAAAGLLRDSVDSAWLSKALETWLIHEVRSYNLYSLRQRRLFYYALPSELEIDLIVETQKALSSRSSEIVGLEFKLSKKWRREWEKPLRDLAASKKARIKRMIGVYTGSERLTFDDFEVLPVADFLSELHAGRIF